MEETPVTEEVKTEDKIEPLIKALSTPLGMPQGSVRSIITITLLAITCGLLAFQIDVPEWFSSLVVGTVSFYFGTRKVTSTPE